MEIPFWITLLWSRLPDPYSTVGLYLRIDSLSLFNSANILKRIILPEQRSLHHSDGFVGRLIVELDHRQLNVGLEGEAVPLRIVVHQLQQVVALTISPHFNLRLKKIT